MKNLHSLSEIDDDDDDNDDDDDDDDDDDEDSNNNMITIKCITKIYDKTKIYNNNNSIKARKIITGTIYRLNVLVHDSNIY